MANLKKVKPTFGREMEPCEYKEKWANKLPPDQVVKISAENNKGKGTREADQSR